MQNHKLFIIKKKLIIKCNNSQNNHRYELQITSATKRVNFKKTDKEYSTFRNSRRVNGWRDVDKPEN